MDSTEIFVERIFPSDECGRVTTLYTHILIKHSFKLLWDSVQNKNIIIGISQQMFLHKSGSQSHWDSKESLHMIIYEII